MSLTRTALKTTLLPPDLKYASHRACFATPNPVLRKRPILTRVCVYPQLAVVSAAHSSFTPVKKTGPWCLEPWSSSQPCPPLFLLFRVNRPRQKFLLDYSNSHEVFIKAQVIDPVVELGHHPLPLPRNARPEPFGLTRQKYRSTRLLGNHVKDLGGEAPAR